MTVISLAHVNLLNAVYLNGRIVQDTHSCVQGECQVQRLNVKQPQPQGPLERGAFSQHLVGRCRLSGGKRVAEQPH